MVEHTVHVCKMLIKERWGQDLVQPVEEVYL